MLGRLICFNTKAETLHDLNMFVELTNTLKDIRKQGGYCSYMKYLTKHKIPIDDDPIYDMRMSNISYNSRLSTEHEYTMPVTILSLPELSQLEESPEYEAQYVAAALLDVANSTEFIGGFLSRVTNKDSTKYCHQPFASDLFWKSFRAQPVISKGHGPYDSEMKDLCQSIAKKIDKKDELWTKAALVLMRLAQFFSRCEAYERLFREAGKTPAFEDNSDLKDACNSVLKALE